ncbi:MAG: HAMP domain-containing histidine kinase [Methylotenera sp.]|nr:HAMP domain-containing histidine kinase [Oligoflexia bacterium]
MINSRTTFPIINNWSGRAAFAIAVLCICLALAAATQRFLHIDETLFILLTGTVLVSLVAGFVAGSLVAMIVAFGQNLFFQTPRITVGTASSAQVFELVLFLVASFFLGWVGSQLRIAFSIAKTAKEEAETATRAREDLLAIVSHDLKNPLAAVRLNAQLLGKQPGIDDSEPASKMVRTIIRSTDRATRLIQDLLDFEKVRSGNLSVDLGNATPLELLTELHELMEQLAAQTTSIISVIEPIPEVPFACDKHRLIQALGNLVGNAVKFTSEGGTISIGCLEEHGSLRFFVRDTGPGIRTEDQPYLFDRYWQAAKTARQGTGLGLAITKGIVEAHNGRLWVESAPGEGSTFWFEIPKKMEVLTLGPKRQPAAEANDSSTGLKGKN